VRIEQSNKGQPFRKWVQPHVRVGVASMTQEKEIVLGCDGSSYAFGYRLLKGGFYERRERNLGGFS
jgi:hypothetical protein